MDPTRERSGERETFHVDRTRMREPRISEPTVSA
jgi:hypothetical protein